MFELKHIGEPPVPPNRLAQLLYWPEKAKTHCILCHDFVNSYNIDMSPNPKSNGVVDIQEVKFMVSRVIRVLPQVMLFDHHKYQTG